MARSTTSRSGLLPGARLFVRRQVRSQTGFSLMELLVVMLIMFVVLGAIYTVWFGLQRSYSFTNDDLTAQYQARTAMAEMVEFIRTSRTPDPAPSEALNVVIYTAEANKLVFWTDTDRDAEHDLELCRFRVNTTEKTLYRDTSQTGDPAFGDGTQVRLVTNCVTNGSSKPLFTYIGADGQAMDAPVADPSLIREVHIDLLIDIYEENRPIAHELTSTVQPRNLRQY
jgi:prepilin-type N-terminal cleavage/methylation domain-containing protein